ncbi:hypothetical protein GCM10009780_54460 [Actinomadura alba]
MYRSQMTNAISTDISPAAAESARDTLPGALQVAEHVPGQLRTELIETARDAFSQGLQLTATIAAPVMLGLAVLTAVLLRHVHTVAEPQNQPVLNQEEEPACP